MVQILVVDDDAAIRELLKRVLEAAGYRVTLASHGEEAMTLFRQEPADLIITDIIMPVKQGIDTITEVLKDFPSTKIIAISGGGRRLGPYSYLMLAKQCGAHKVFNKPIKRDELLAAIRELLESG